jgi:hypothetical protein
MKYAGACKLCPPNTMSASAATSSSECKCVANYFAAILPLRDPNDNRVKGPDCQICPNPGSDCTEAAGAPGFTVFTLPLATNHWRVSQRSVDVRVCPTNAAGASACLGGRGEIGPDGNVSYCRNGTAGPLCSLCVNEGDYLDEDGSECLPCGSYDNSFLYVFPLTLLALSPFVALVIWKARRSRKVRLMVASFLRLRNRLSLRAKIKALWSFFQVSPNHNPNPNPAPNPNPHPDLNPDPSPNPAVVLLPDHEQAAQGLRGTYAVDRRRLLQVTPLHLHRRRHDR